MHLSEPSCSANIRDQLHSQEDRRCCSFLDNVVAPRLRVSSSRPLFLVFFIPLLTHILIFLQTHILANACTPRRYSPLICRHQALHALPGSQITIRSSRKSGAQSSILSSHTPQATTQTTAHTTKVLLLSSLTRYVAPGRLLSTLSVDLPT